MVAFYNDDEAAVADLLHLGASKWPRGGLDSRVPAQDREARQPCQAGTWLQSGLAPKVATMAGLPKRRAP